MKFTEILNQIIDQLVPAKKLKFNKHFLVNSRSTFLYEKMRRAYRKWKNLNDIAYLQKFKEIKKLYRCSLLKSRHKIEAEIVSSKCPQKFYKYINKFFNNSKSDKIAISVKGIVETNPIIVANSFNDYFISVFNPAIGNVITTDFSDDKSSPLLDEITVKKAILSMSNSMSVGPDIVPSIFWKNLVLVLSPFLTKLFNKFLDNGYFPEIWKISKIKPLYKGSGNKTDPSTYRPIALTCVLCKIFEKCVVMIISNKLNIDLHTSQHGFRKKQSTLTNILQFYNALFTQKSKSHTIDMIAFDLSKAFDKISHAILIKKISKYITDRRIILFFENFLLNRKQFVALEGVNSLLLPVSSGVPQGSVLGPLLFSVYINDIFDLRLNSFLNLYADDIKMFGVAGDALQKDIDTLCVYFTANSLLVNLKKTFALSVGRKPSKSIYYINGLSIDRTDIFKDLGVLTDSNFTYHSHVMRVKQKCCRLINIAFRVFANKDRSFFLKFYISYVIPIIDYCSPVYLNFSITVII